MLPHLENALHAIYHKALRLFNMDQPIRYREVPKGRTDLEDYYENLKDHYIVNGTPRMELFRVDEVQLWKNTTKAYEHEYVIAKIRGPRGHHSLVFEHIQGQKVDKQHSNDPQVSTTSQPPTLVPEPAEPSETLGDSGSAKLSRGNLNVWGSSVGSFNSLSSTSSSTQHANDTVEALSGSTRNVDHKICRVLSFVKSPAGPLPFYELVVLLHTIHTNNKHYQALGDNCYFFAEVIMNVLKEVYGPTEHQEKTIL